MKIEQQVVSLKLAKKLKELGVEQESIWWWCKTGGGFSVEETWSPFAYTYDAIKPQGSISAYTVAELGEMLPFLTSKGKSGGDYHMVSTDFFYDKKFTDTTEANARARCLIWLIENGHYEPLPTDNSQDTPDLL
jgi:hypothetical protein